MAVMLIDFHTHCYKDELATRAIEFGRKNGITPHFDGTILGLKNFMKAKKIDYAVVLNIANKPEHTINVNNWAIECSRQERIISFGSVHPFYKDYKDEIKRLYEAGIKGLKFHPNYQHYEVNDKSIYPVYEEAAKYGMVMLFHVGLDKMPGEYGISPKFGQLIDDLKYDKIVGAHLGGCLTFDAAAEFVWGKNVYIDVSLSFRFLTPQLKEKLKQTHDISKILYGSDAPWATIEEDLKQINELFDKQEQEQIYYKNACRLLDINII